MAQAGGATQTRRQSRGRGAASQPSAEDLKLLERIHSGALRVAPEDTRPEQDGGDGAGRAFTLGPEQVALVEQGRGRKPVDPAYLEDMREMIEKPGQYAGYQITTASPASLIQSKIRRAARECDLETSDYSVYVRAREGFVAFSVHQT